MSQTFEVPKLGSTAGPAFDWLCQELELPNEAARLTLRQAFVDQHNQGSRNAAKKLVPLWPEGARWPSGEAWIKNKASGLRDRVDDLMFLLHMRHVRVAHRLYRDAQVRSMIHPESPDRIPSYTHVIVNSINFSEDAAETNICGLKYGHVMSIAAGLVFMQKPAHTHPECHCTIGPYDSRKRGAS